MSALSPRAIEDTRRCYAIVVVSVMPSLFAFLCFRRMLPLRARCRCRPGAMMPSIDEIIRSYDIIQISPLRDRPAAARLRTRYLRHGAFHMMREKSRPPVYFACRPPVTHTRSVTPLAATPLYGAPLSYALDYWRH